MKHKIEVDRFDIVSEGNVSELSITEVDITFRSGDIILFREVVDNSFTGRAVEAVVSGVIREGSVVTVSFGLAGPVVSDSWPDDGDPNVTRDLLSLVSVNVPVEVVKSWNYGERQDAERWASAMFLDASDNHGIEIPPVPPHVVKYK